MVEPGPYALAHTLGGMAKAADFFLRTPTLKASNFAATMANIFAQAIFYCRNAIFLQGNIS